MNGAGVADGLRLPEGTGLLKRNWVEATSRGGRPFAASLRSGLERMRSWRTGLRKSATSAMGLRSPWSFRTVVWLAAPVTFASARGGCSFGSEA